MLGNVVNLKECQKSSVRRVPIQMVDESIIGVSPRAIVFDIPPSQREMVFCIAGGEPQSLTVPYPHLVGAGIVNAKNEIELHLVGLRRRGKPLLDTPVFHAPLMNVDAAGRITIDQSISDIGVSVSSVPFWIEVLSNTKMTSVAHERTVRIKDLKPGASVSTYNHLRFWQSLARKGGRFPNWSLVDRREKFGEWIAGLADRT